MSREQIQERMLQSNFNVFLGLKVISADPEKQEVVMRLKKRLEFERRGGQWHGGPIAGVIDTVGDYALAMMTGRPLPTINLRVDYLRPADSASLTVVARVRRSGKTVAVVDVEVSSDDSGVLVAIGRLNYSTAAPRMEEQYSLIPDS